MGRKAVELSDADLALGRNLRRLREEQGMTQSALVAAMVAEGHAWQTNTLSKIESPTADALPRRVTFGEALSLASILGITAEELACSSSPERTDALAAGRRLRGALERADVALADVIGASEQFLEALDAYRASGGPMDDQLQSQRALVQPGSMKNWKAAQYDIGRALRG
jgi:transcriptional regulator with XRE-family HTH domain